MHHQIFRQELSKEIEIICVTIFIRNPKATRVITRPTYLKFGFGKK